MGSSWSIVPLSITVLRGPPGDLAQLALPSPAIVLDVHQHPRPGTHAPRQHQVDQVLERRQPLALAADERTQRLALRVVHARHIDLGGVAGGRPRRPRGSP